MTLRASGPSLAQLPDDAIVTTADVARYLGTSPRTIMRSTIPRVYITARTPRFRVGDVRGWIRAQTQGVA